LTWIRTVPFGVRRKKTVAIANAAAIASSKGREVKCHVWSSEPYFVVCKFILTTPTTFLPEY
jgi:hypothetical protein